MRFSPSTTLYRSTQVFTLVIPLRYRFFFLLDLIPRHSALTLVISLPLPYRFSLLVDLIPRRSGRYPGEANAVSIADTHPQHPTCQFSMLQQHESDFYLFYLFCHCHHGMGIHWLGFSERRILEIHLLHLRTSLLTSCLLERRSQNWALWLCSDQRWEFLATSSLRLEQYINTDQQLVIYSVGTTTSGTTK